jgi:hypothetical protein
LGIGIALAVDGAGTPHGIAIINIFGEFFCNFSQIFLVLLLGLDFPNWLQLRVQNID